MTALATELRLSAFLYTLVGLTLLSWAPNNVSAQETNNPVEKKQTEQVAATYRGGLLSPPLPKPKFTLYDTSGEAFDFFARTQGYVTLLFFGYTHCPDVCPLQMQIIAQALKKIPRNAASEFRVVFVTTDPDRDSPALLRSWLDHFDKRFIGLTGSQSAINAAQIAANLAPAKKSAVRPDGTYEVGHSAFAFLYTKDNLAHVIYPAGVKQEDLIHDLPLLAEEAWTRR
jgi:protein SCO1